MRGAAAGPHPFGRRELDLYLSDHPGVLSGALRYRTELFGPAMVEDLRSDFLAAVDALCQDPGARLEAVLGRLSAGERARWDDRARSMDEAGRMRLRGVRRQAIPVQAAG